MTDTTTPPPFPTSSAQGPRRLSRSTKNRAIAGVMAGLAEYLDIDVMALRVGFVAASLFLLGGVGGPVLYLLAWAIVPEEGKAASLAAETMEAKPWQHWACRCGGRPNQAAGGTN